MAMDFPASPTVGQQVTLGNNTYIWDGTAWNIVPQSIPPFMSDTPPANPFVGQFWYRGTNGQLYMYVDDGNSKQWVQAAGSRAAPTVWQQIGTEWVVNGLTLLDIPNLDAYKRLRVVGEVAAAGSTAIGFRASSNNGSSFFAGATDYSFQYVQGLGATTIPNSGTNTLWLLSSGATDAAAVVHFETTLHNFNLAGGDKGGTVLTKFRSGASMSASFYGAAINQAGAMNALRMTSLAGSVLTGSFMLEGVRG